MDSSDLLARENEFKKLNKQLEKKTESLMKEIEDVMQRSDIFSDISYKLSLTSSPVNVQKHNCNSTQISRASSGNSCKKKNFVTCSNIAKKYTNSHEKDDSGINNKSSQDQQQNRGHLNTTSEYSCRSHMERQICQNCIVSKNEQLNNDIEFLYAFVSINVKENILPESFLKEKVTVESVCKFLAAKVKLLQEQIKKMENTMEKQGRQCEGHLAQIAELEGERMALLNRANKAKADLAEGRAKYMVSQAHLEEKERLFREQRGAADGLRAELRRLRGWGAALEARGAAGAEAAAALRHQLAAARADLQEAREGARALAGARAGAAAAEGARVARLAAAVRAQHALVRNLRRQNELLAAHHATAALATDYAQLLTQRE